ncbi:MAG: DUF5696 domain-containing protein [Oscillospiraceae bacterium]|nr:DUF5696 domain-containing protein [Oscillospiraceae bacterium]
MKNKSEALKRLLAMLIALVMVLAVVPLSAAPVFASAADEEDDDDEAKLEAERIKLYLTTEYENPAEKLKDFGAKTVEHVEGTGKNAVTTYLPDGKPVFSKDGYELYFQYDTGEVAVKDLATGQVLFSNPYDIGGESSSEDVKFRIMSQISIKYKVSGDKTQWFYSFKDAAMNRQIKMKKIKGGIRVEYTLGKEEKRKLVPRRIERSSFDDNILQFITNKRDLDKMNAYYTLKDANAPDLTERAKKELQITYPETKTYAIYVFDPNASERELNQIEGFIKQYTKYTFEMMDEDHNLLGFEPKDKAPPLVKMALEYYIDADGMYVRLPANGIRFDESNYKIEQIYVLQYMGAGRRENTGYTFVPDGSGSLMRYEDIKDTAFVMTSDIYGPDYSFRNVTGGTNTKRWRMPVFGAVENYEIVTTTKVEQIEAYYDENGQRLEEPATAENEEGALEEVYYDETGKELTSPKKIFVDEDENEYETAPKPIKEKRSDGFLAIIEDGDVMAKITTEADGNTSKYNHVSAIFNPRPTDEYNLSFETKGINSLITVASRRKYAGNYIIRYVMLSSDADGKPKKSNGYEASYVGMAKAYRDYLMDKGEIVQMADDSQGIPLFIESLGMIKTAEYFLGFPYEGDTALTSFEDVESMIDELNAEGIMNLKFKYVGWINKGLKGLAPVKLNIEKALGGKTGFQDMVDYGKSKNAEIYPEMDFTLIWWWQLLDGVTPKKDFARFMDQLYAYEQPYNFMRQDFSPSRGYNLIAHERSMSMYESAMTEYSKYSVGALSVSSLARELHSNHYKKSLTNRVDAVGHVRELFEKMYDDHGKLLADEANAYAFKYLDSIVNVDLDGTRMLNQSEAVPFYSMVVHGSINIAGTPINMSGDYKYDVLKAIENGASPFFVLAYQNSSRLKEASMWSLNSYYAVDYETWFPSMVEIYKLLNDALGSVKTKLITNHEILERNVIRVTYEGGTSFVLNYNGEKEVTVGGKTIEPLGFVKLN